MHKCPSSSLLLLGLICLAWPGITQAQITLPVVELPPVPDENSPILPVLGTPSQRPDTREDQDELPIQLDLPKPEQLFRPESEATWRDRLRREGEQQHRKVEFPREESHPGVIVGGRCRQLPPGVAWVVPDVVCYRPLYFEDKNTERYGWRVVGLQPLLSTGKFYLDVLFLPYKMSVLPPRACECNAGYPKPGDPVPYLIYLPPWSWKGAVSEVESLVDGFGLFRWMPTLGLQIPLGGSGITWSVP